MTDADIREFFAAVGEGRLEVVEDRLADDVVLVFPGRRFGGRFEGRRRVLVFLRQNRRLFRDGLTFALEWVAVVGDKAVAQWRNHGVTRDGNDYHNRGVTIFSVADGRIARIEDYLDTEEMVRTWPR